MVPPTRHGPQRGARLLWIPSQVPTSTRMPLGLCPRPWDYLGATVQGRSHPGPQGELAAHREEMHRCGFLSAEVQQMADQPMYRV